MNGMIDESLSAMVKSQEQLARSLQAESVIAGRMAKLLRRVKGDELRRRGGESYTEAEQSVAREIAAYVHGIADFEHALADHVKFAIKELRIAEEE
ncbi:hypothetical protein [Paenibacillus sp.]|uniref:hypothetical protein n=1 Tax=Paenibacillus sp. TaxID=58172 RepID=UPI002D7574E5|nr:hypothetical protein [Paenibacillus sp.]HZG56429.1 hypothetical protein [Paenibacillus sp.]